jgi:antitoxin component YwqK of YwqJK toxin-antitoxin module
MIRLLIILCVSVTFLTGYVAKAQKADSLSTDGAAIAANIRALHSEDGETRTVAAESLRRIIAKHQSGMPDIRRADGGESAWMEKVDRIVPGMTELEVEMILPPFSDSPEKLDFGGLGCNNTSHRLDYNWIVRVQYCDPHKVIERPTLIKRTLSVYVSPPENFTGTWICWYVNGQKAYEIQYKDGKYHGVFKTFHDNGQKSVEQHYINHMGDGPDTGWYPDAKIMYTAQYKNGQQDGKWIHYYQNANKQSEMSFKNGKFEGSYAGWFENGQMRYLMNYANGVQNGIEAAWNEQGVLQYKRECKTGKVVP